MPAPIVGAAAAAAARLVAKKLASNAAKKSAKLTLSQKAGKAVVSATTGKTSARKYAESKMRSNASKASVSKALKIAKKSKPLAEPKSGVKVLPRKTAPKTDLSNRGNRPTRSQRSERAADLSFKKAEARYEGEYLTRMTGLKGPKGVTSQRTRSQGTRSLRKEAAIKKEANKSTPIQINSARFFTNPNSGNIFRGTDILKSNNARALKATNKPKPKKKSK
jgi:hypothetical protein